MTQKMTLEGIKYYFVELPKFEKGEHQLETPADRWCYFMKHARKLTHVPELLSAEPYLTALRIAETSNLNKAEWDAYDESLVWAQDQLGKPICARHEGKVEGMKEGREEGLKEGKDKARREIAARLLATGMSQDLVQQVLGRDEA